MCNNNVRIATRANLSQNLRNHLAFDRGAEDIVRICIEEIVELGITFPRHLRPGDRTDMVRSETSKIVLKYDGPNYVFFYTPGNSCAYKSAAFTLADDNRPLMERVIFDRHAEDLAVECMHELAKHSVTFPAKMEPSQQQTLVDTPEQRICAECGNNGKFRFVRRTWRSDGTAIPEYSANFVLV